MRREPRWSARREFSWAMHSARQVAVVRNRWASDSTIAWARCRSMGEHAQAESLAAANAVAPCAFSACGIAGAKFRPQLRNWDTDLVSAGGLESSSGLVRQHVQRTHIEAGCSELSAAPVRKHVRGNRLLVAAAVERSEVQVDRLVCAEGGRDALASKRATAHADHRAVDAVNEDRRLSGGAAHLHHVTPNILVHPVLIDLTTRKGDQDFSCLASCRHSSHRGVQQ